MEITTTPVEAQPALEIESLRNRGGVFTVALLDSQGNRWNESMEDFANKHDDRRWAHPGDALQVLQTRGWTRGRKLIVVESTCAPFAEADDLIELQPGGFDGDDVYALEYAKPSCSPHWSGLRRVRANCGRLQVEEGTGWANVTDAVRFVGKVCDVFKPRSRNLFTLEIA